MSDREHARPDRDDAGRRFGSEKDHDPRRSGAGDESRTWSSEDDRNDRGRGADTPYGRLHTGSQNRPDAGWSGGGYGDQGGFGSQHGQGGYASPAQGARYGQTGSEWGRSGYGSEGGHRDAGRYGGGEAGGFGATSYAAERDSHEHRSGGAQRDYGVQGQGYGQPSGGTYGQQDYGRSAQRSQFRNDQNAGAYADRGGGFAGDPRGQTGASGHDDDHEPHYRRWRDQQLETHDRDYARWRTTQAKRYDDEYRSYRDQRHDSFSREFGDWRDKGRQDAKTPDAPSSAQPAPTSGQNGGTPLTAADDSLRNVTDGGSGRHDHDKGDDKS